MTSLTVSTILHYYNVILYCNMIVIMQYNITILHYTLLCEEEVCKLDIELPALMGVE